MCHYGLLKADCNSEMGFKMLSKSTYPRASAKNDISIGSAVFTGVTVVTNTERQTN